MPRFKWGRRLSCGWIIHHHCLLQGYWDAKLLSLPDVLIQPSGQCLFYGLCHFYIGPNWQLFYGLTFPCIHHPPRSRLPSLSMHQEEKCQCLGRCLRWGAWPSKPRYHLSFTPHCTVKYLSAKQLPDEQLLGGKAKTKSCKRKKKVEPTEQRNNWSEKCKTKEELSHWCLINNNKKKKRIFYQWQV